MTRAAAVRAASSTWIVPALLTAASNGGRAIVMRTFACAARWTIAFGHDDCAQPAPW